MNVHSAIIVRGQHARKEKRKDGSVCILSKDKNYLVFCDSTRSATIGK